jgi:colanic acid/amylovoran biosynthesis protein
MKILLLGASFDTGNLGVSALAESSIKCILYRWPDADVQLFASGRSINEHSLNIQGREVNVTNLPIRFSKNIFLLNHFFVLFNYALLLRTIRCKWFEQFCFHRNFYLKDIIETDLIVDITGGDSFSDIYGMIRLIMGLLLKWLVLLFNKKLIFLPQTYGPFSKKISKLLAVFILERSEKIYSRDNEGVEYLRRILKTKTFYNKVQLMPDVAFILDPIKPKQSGIDSSIKIRKKNNVIIGFNISGLLYNGGYNRNNMFKLIVDYRKIIEDIIDFFMSKENIIVVLIPHVIPHPGFETSVESDPVACLQVYKSAIKKYKGRIFLAEGNYNHNEIKYIIGMMDFFLGSRMHSCIAAISQCIPTIGLAYSKKFSGVFETVGMEQYVGDMCYSSEKDILDIITKTFKERKKIETYLINIIPDIKEKVLNIFQDYRTNI